MAGDTGFLDAVFQIVKESYRLHAIQCLARGGGSVNVEASADDAAFRVNAELVKLYGGTPTYIPKEGTYMRQGIIRDFTGDNVAEIAKHYGCTTDTVYRILREDRKTKSGLQQGRFPGV